MFANGVSIVVDKQLEFPCADSYPVSVVSVSSVITCICACKQWKFWRYCSDVQSQASEHSLIANAISKKTSCAGSKNPLLAYVPYNVYANRRAAGNTYFKHARMCGSFRVQAVRIYADVLKKQAGLFSSTICLSISLVILDFSRLFDNGDLPYLVR